MTMRQACNHRTPLRAELEKCLSADMRAMTAQSDRIGRHFARLHNVSNSDFQALLHIMVGETTGNPLTIAQLRQRMDMSAAAVTYLVDRMIDSGHIRREADPEDRRKCLLRYEDRGMTLAFAFFGPLGAHVRSGMGHLDDYDLAAAHRVFTAMIASMSIFENELCTNRDEPSEHLEPRPEIPRPRVESLT